jgi:hypothetical protein
MVWEVKTNRMAPLYTHLFFGWTISLVHTPCVVMAVSRWEKEGSFLKLGEGIVFVVRVVAPTPCVVRAVAGRSTVLCKSQQYWRNSSSSLGNVGYLLNFFNIKFVLFFLKKQFVFYIIAY